MKEKLIEFVYSVLLAVGTGVILGTCYVIAYVWR